MLVDTHAHLNFKDFQKDLDQIIKRAVDAGVKKIICASSNLKDSQNAIKIAQKYPNIVSAAVGIHPHDSSSVHYDTIKYHSEIKRLKKLATSPEVIAIGECGLDYSPAPPGERTRSKREQISLFEEQIKLAIQLNKPLLIHSRKAFNDVIEILQNNFSSSSVCSRGVFHCYAGGKKGIKKVNELGFYFGVDGNLTYDEGLQNVFKEIPLEKILLETDCPYLAPVPFRGQRSEPVHVKIIAEFLAKLKGVSFKKVAKITTQNAERLFKI
jgi:TatD DNase family protein